MNRQADPLAIDLYCGLGGWTEGLLAEGYRVIGFDNEQHIYGEARYPGQLVIQDVLTLHGSQFKDAALIVASPPCQAYSYRAMPWTRAKALPPPDNSLFEACFRIQREACEAAGRYIPLVVENVCGAQKWVGRARWHYGSFYLWGDVPALMPITSGIRKTAKAYAHSGSWKTVDGDDWRATSNKKNSGGSWFGIQDQREQKPRNDPRDGIKQGGDWFNATQPSISRQTGSKSSARKAASAHIAKIPIALARHIAQAWWPVSQERQIS